MIKLITPPLFLHFFFSYILTLFFSHLPECSEKQELWEGPGLSTNEIANISGLDEIKKRNELIRDLQKLLLNTAGCAVSYDATTMQAIRDGLAEVSLFIEMFGVFFFLQFFCWKSVFY